MKKVIFYQLFILTTVVLAFILPASGVFPSWFDEYKLPYQCILIGTVGGLLYCLRAIYIQKCVKGQWSENWELWYYLRPITSSLAGLVSYLFLKAGLIILEADQSSDASNFGFLALAFVAGLNVDNFIKKIESISESIWGINKSSMAKDNDK